MKVSCKHISMFVFSILLLSAHHTEAADRCSVSSLKTRAASVSKAKKSCSAAQKNYSKLKKARASQSKIKAAKSKSKTQCNAYNSAQSTLNRITNECKARLPELPAPSVENATRKQQLLDDLLNYAYRFWNQQIVEKALTYKVSSSCWDRMLNPNGASYSDGVFMATSVAGSIEKYTTQRGWSPIQTLEVIETANNYDRVSQLPVISSLTDTLAANFHYTLNLEEVNCNEEQYAKIRNYFSVVVSNYALYNYQPLAGKTLITLIVTPRVSDIMVGTNKERTEIYIFAPSEFEPSGWGEKMDLGIRAVTGS